jgi:predicted nucleic acid-binding protein
LRFLIDTNVLAEGARAAPDPYVSNWLRAQPPLDLAISVLAFGEIQRGLELLPTSRRRSALESWLAKDLPLQFQGRVLMVDELIAREWGRLSARSRASGRPLALIDGLLLATASIHGLTLVTRHEADCAARGVPVLNPWREG